MKTRDYLSIGTAIAAVLLTSTLIFLRQMAISAEEEARWFAGLHTTTQHVITQYVQEQQKLRTGDLVEVHSLEKLDSPSRVFMVDEVTKLGTVIVSDWRTQQKPQVMMLEPGIKAGYELTLRNAFRFIRQDSQSWQANADWYLLQ